MITTFILSVLVDMVSVIFAVFPAFGNLIASFTSGLITVLGYALMWEWLLPVQEGLQLIVINLQFQLGIALVMFVKWLIEMFFNAV